MTHSDISFWRNRKSVVGISVRSIFLNVLCQFIILLYLFDNVRVCMLVCMLAATYHLPLYKEIMQASYFYTDSLTIP